MIKKQYKVSLIFIVILVCVLCCSCSRAKSSESALNQYKTCLSDNHFIMHALGGVDNTYTYTNSLDALQLAYDEGERFFEVDISFTKDKKLVLAHCNGKGAYVDDGEDNVWNKNDWEKRLGLPYDEKHTLATYDEFMSFTIQDKFAPSSFYDLASFMKKHEIYVTIDVGNRSYKETKKIYSEIAQALDYDEDLLNHLIVGGQSTKMVKAVKEVYNFPMTYLYYGAKSDRQKKVATPTDFLSYCQENNISCFATSYEIYESEDLSLLVDSGLIAYVYTVDDADIANKLLDSGVDAVGTNFLREKDYK